MRFFERGEQVYFDWEGERIYGKVLVCDSYGGGVCFGVCPSYDVKTEDEAIYKHIPADEVFSVDEAE